MNKALATVKEIPAEAKPTIHKVSPTSEFKKRQHEVTQARIEKKAQCNFCDRMLEVPTKKLVDFYEAMMDTSIETQPFLALLQSGV